MNTNNTWSVFVGVRFVNNEIKKFNGECAILAGSFVDVKNWRSYLRKRQPL